MPKRAWSRCPQVGQVVCLFAFLKPKFEFEGIFGNVLGHLLRINRENLKFLIFSCILGGLRLFYTIGKLYTQTRYGKPCVFLLSLDQKSSAIHVSSSVFSALLESPVKGRIFWFLRTVFRNNCVFLTYFSWKWMYNFPIV